MSRPESRQGISTAVVNTVARALDELGAPPVTDLLDHDSSYVDGTIADALLDDAARALGDEAIGLSVARAITPGSLGLLDYALFTGERWGDAIRRVAQFYATATERVTMTIEEAADEAAVALTRHPFHRHNRHWIELSFAIVTERARQAIGPEFRVRAVDFMHDAPASEAAHREFFEAPVRFGRPRDRLAFDPRFLDAPLKTGAAVLVDALVRRLAELVPPVIDGTMVRVREAIGHGIDKGDLTLEAAAGRVHMSPRSLQRELRDRGTSFKEQVDVIRRDRALALLQSDAVPISEIAHRVGFADPTAFFRAFRRWTGTTPARRRVGGA